MVPSLHASRDHPEASLPAGDASRSEHSAICIVRPRRTVQLSVGVRKEADRAAGIVAERKPITRETTVTI